ncbi:MAG: hypothetical protein LBR10_13810, partial [Prevotellaceae bacterium]|nr:hypothetical protein [Prevotellaceae bacterium]
EDENLFRNDTLFLNLWHNTKETGNTQIARSHVAVNLSNYDGYLWGRDSTVISIKYKAERLDTSTPATYTYNAMYRRKYNSNGLY